ncbi:Tryptophan synthase alpha chain [Planctomycetes bacterium Pla163]|uniref:Tryptophan synthase alpha chain n=1 Tax=Rohdeia mirabilis TaxID=2528008 RepID=A0A518CYT7_9BACT|nr:Tryptophan synthase alpha chain [Planctomycetes bacterium Pla163]
MNRLDHLTRQLEPGDGHAAHGRRPSVVPYVTAGDGGWRSTVEVLHGIEAAGAVAVELGMPHSDPVADGPILQQAAARALRSGFSFADFERCVAQYRSEGGSLGIVAFGYANVLLEAHGRAGLARLERAGVDGIAIADLPFEEASELREAARSLDLGTVFFAAPNTSRARLEALADAATGFVYALARRGTTGRATAIDSTLKDHLALVRAASSHTLLAVGFGLTSRADIDRLRGHCDLAVVGSALVEYVHRERAIGRDVRTAARRFVARLVEPAPS